MLFSLLISIILINLSHMLHSRHYPLISSKKICDPNSAIGESKYIFLLIGYHKTSYCNEDKELGFKYFCDGLGMKFTQEIQQLKLLAFLLGFLCVYRDIFLVNVAMAREIAFCWAKLRMKDKFELIKKEYYNLR